MRSIITALAVLLVSVPAVAQGQTYYARERLAALKSDPSASQPTVDPNAPKACTGTPAQRYIHNGFSYEDNKHFNQIEGGPTPFQQAVDHCHAMKGIKYCSIMDQGWTAMAHWYNDDRGVVFTNDPTDYTITCP